MTDNTFTFPTHYLIQPSQWHHCKLWTLQRKKGFSYFASAGPCGLWSSKTTAVGFYILPMAPDGLIQLLLPCLWWVKLVCALQLLWQWLLNEPRPGEEINSIDDCALHQPVLTELMSFFNSEHAEKFKGRLSACILIIRTNALLQSKGLIGKVSGYQCQERERVSDKQFILEGVTE